MSNLNLDSHVHLDLLVALVVVDGQVLHAEGVNVHDALVNTEEYMYEEEVSSSRSSRSSNTSSRSSSSKSSSSIVRT